MHKQQNYETEIPADYVLVKHVDAKSDKKLVGIYSVLSFVPFLLYLLVLYVIARYSENGLEIRYENSSVIPTMLLGAAMLVYIVLHELVHGITYKYYTGSKLTFGLTLTVAFCGVPDIYVRRKASVTALLMPFAVFSIIFSALTIGLWFVSPLYGILAGILLTVHLGGCVGDLHWAILYSTKFKHCNTLMRDTGPEQWLYIPKDEAKKYGITSI